jgi:hypothetical protein
MNNSNLQALANCFLGFGARVAVIPPAQAAMEKVYSTPGVNACFQSVTRLTPPNTLFTKAELALTAATQLDTLSRSTKKAVEMLCCTSEALSPDDVRRLQDAAEVLRSIGVKTMQATRAAAVKP